MRGVGRKGNREMEKEGRESEKRNMKGVWRKWETEERIRREKGQRTEEKQRKRVCREGGSGKNEKEKWVNERGMHRGHTNST
jgi:hypothetical protein